MQQQTSYQNFKVIFILMLPLSRTSAHAFCMKNFTVLTPAIKHEVGSPGWGDG